MRRSRRLARAAAIALLIVVGCLANGCGSSSDEWEGDIIARFEGASESVREARADFRPDGDQERDFEILENLARELEFKGNLIKELKAPEGCARAQEQGHAAIVGLVSGGLGLSARRDYTPYLFDHAREGLAKELTWLKRVTREAESCAAA